MIRNMNTQIESRVASCISVALSLCDDPRFVAWAAAWSAGNRSPVRLAKLQAEILDEAGLGGWWLRPLPVVLAALDSEDRRLLCAVIALSAAEAALWSVRMAAEDPAGIKYAWHDAARVYAERAAAVAASV